MAQLTLAGTIRAVGLPGCSTGVRWWRRARGRRDGGAGEGVSAATATGRRQRSARAPQGGDLGLCEGGEGNKGGGGGGGDVVVEAMARAVWCGGLWARAVARHPRAVPSPGGGPGDGSAGFGRGRWRAGPDRWRAGRLMRRRAGRGLRRGGRRRGGRRRRWGWRWRWRRNTAHLVRLAAHSAPSRAGAVRGERTRSAAERSAWTVVACSVRPAEALGRACQRDSRSEGPGAAPAPEDRPCHPCFAARKTCFYPLYTLW